MRLTKPDTAAYVACLEIYRQCFTGGDRAPDGVFMTAFDGGEVFITREAGVIVGFAIVTIRAGVRYLWAVAVVPSHQKSGRGRSLIREVEWWAQGMNESEIELTVATSNPAQKLYFDAGYRVVKFLRNYYAEGDGLLMRRKLR